MSARPVPAGFEDVVAGQLEQLDIRLMGRSAGMATLLVTPDTVQFQRPGDVLAALDLSDGARGMLLPALSDPLPRNTYLACRHGMPETGCGYLPPPVDPASVQVIYDEGEGAVHLFIAREWLPLQRAGEDPFHRVSENAENALIHHHSFNVSGGRHYQNINVNGNGMLGLFRDGHIGVDWNYVRQQASGRGAQQALSVNDFYYRHDFGRQHYLQAGRMDRRNLSSAQGGSFGFGMLPLDRFDGARVGTTQAYLDQQQLGQGSPLTVLLSRNAQVDAFDGERLLQTFYLEAGINELDTTYFPPGNYLVTLRVYEDGVFARSEEAPFNKTGQSFGDGSLQWFVQGGRRADRHRLEPAGNEGVLQAGLRVPLHEQIALTLGGAAIGSINYAEGRIEARHAQGANEFNGALGWLRGSDGSHGVQQQVGFRRYLSWNLYHQRMRGSACRQSGYTSLDGLGCQTSLSASVAMPLAGGNLYLGYTRRASYSPLRESDLLPGPEMPWLPPPGLPLPDLRQAQLSRTLQASFNRSLQWKDFTVSTRAGVYRQRRSQQRDDNGVYLNLAFARLDRAPVRTRQDRLALDMQHTRERGGDVAYRVGQNRRWETEAGYRELGGELNGRNDDRQGAMLSGRLQNASGHTGATVSQYRSDGRSEMSYSAVHTSSVALARSGWYVGGGLNGGAGVAVKVDNAEDLDLRGPAAEVNVAGARRQRVDFGARRLLPTQAYHPSRAEVQDVSGHDSAASVRVAGQGAGQPLFLPPGRLLTLPIALDVTYTFIGTARGSNGESLDGARVLNAPVPALGRGGGFVADFPQREQTLYLLQESRLLQCPLTVRERRSVLLLVGEVECEPLAVDRLPALIQQQARVQRLLHEQSLVPSAAAAASVEMRK
ncbi:MAG: TcfC E-set like domain-containing protein [Stenotrophomonas maltophilia]